MRSSSIAKSLAAAAGLAVGTCTTLAALTWLRYGRTAAPHPAERDPVLDRFMPVYDIVERHHIRVQAPAAMTLDVACGIDLQATSLVRSIFRAREVVLRAAAPPRRPRGLLDEMQSLGWGVLADIADRELVAGAATRPWEANVTFRALPPERFAAFDEPNYVKIAWTLRADPVDERTSIFRTETRAVATDASARARFRRYWALFSPGIVVIRWALLRPVKREAERRASAA